MSPISLQRPLRRAAYPRERRRGAISPTCCQPVSEEQFEQIQVRIEGEERARAAKIERTLQARFAGEMAKAEATKKAEVEKARKDAAAQIEKAKRDAEKTAKAALAPKVAEAERQIKSLKAEQQAVIDQRLHEQREALDRARVEAVNAEKAAAYAERMRQGSPEGRTGASGHQLQRACRSARGDRRQGKRTEHRQ
jgi:hypothetical protein